MNLYSLTLEEENDSQNAFGEHYCMIASIQLEKSGRKLRFIYDATGRYLVIILNYNR